MSAGMDIDISQVVIPDKCQRCGWNFLDWNTQYRNEPNCSPWYKPPKKFPRWCSECQDILFDRRENEIWSSPSRRQQVVEFFGWKFDIVEAQFSSSPCSIVYIRLWKKLLNPEGPRLDYSFASFTK